MKIHALFLISAILFACCTKEQTSSTGNKEHFVEYSKQLTKSSQDDSSVAYEIIENGHIEFVDYKYRIKISKQEAIELGYTESGYDILLDQVEWINNIIEQQITSLQSDPNIKEYSIKDCTYDINRVEPTLELTTIQTRQEQTTYMPNGVIASSLGEAGWAHFHAPNEMVGVTGHCFSNVALAASHYVEARFGGGANSAARLGYGDLTVKIPASNTSGSLKYIVSDSFGGTFSWKGVTEL